MSLNPPSFKEYSPALMSILPMLYAAWSDMVLTPSEVKYLSKKVDTLNFLSAEEQAMVKTWMNPRNPPSRQLFLHWENTIVTAAKKLPVESRKSLVDLGLAMAQKGVKANKVDNWNNNEVKATLEDLKIHLTWNIRMLSKSKT